MMSSSSAAPSLQRVPSRAAFVPHTKDFYGAINCAEGTSSNAGDPAAANKDASKVSNRLKPSPALLEIRKIKYSVYSPPDNQQESPSSWSPFEHETVLVSRGIPGSVNSTCLDFSKASSPTIRCATGLTSGALAIHCISNIHAHSINSNADESNMDLPTSTVTHYAPRQQRPASSVAWRPSFSGGNSKNGLVAIGLIRSSSSSSNAPSTRSISKAASVGSSSLASRSGVTSNPLGTTSSAGGSTGSIGGGDRDFGCLVWDIEAQSSSVSGAGTVRGKSAAGGRGSPPPPVGKGAVPIKSPVYRFAHNSGVESLSWLMDGQLLAVGCQKRNVQLYDLRMSGTNAAPISVFAHSDAISGIVPDDCCPTKTVFATFGRNAGEPVKIWDARMMDSTLTEIRVPPTQYGAGISAVAWSNERPGELAIAVGDSIRTFYTRAPGSRALPVNVSYVGNGDKALSLQCLAFRPSTTNEQIGYYPHRILTVSSQGEVNIVPESQVAPIAISKRDGRIAHGLGNTVWVGSVEGPSAMEGGFAFANEDVSSRMMRRAICFHDIRYSTDAKNNVIKLEEEKEQLFAQRRVQLSQARSQVSDEDFSETLHNLEQLLHSWRWIALIENLSVEQKGEENSEDFFPAKGLIDAGVMKLLRMTSRETADNGTSDSNSKSDTLFCDIYDSPPRKAAINACGWVKKYGVLRNLLDQCESCGAFERSAALAVWHGDLGECVAALQRGAEDVKTLFEERTDEDASEINTARSAESYRETLSLIAMCVAGFNVTVENDGTMKTSNVWSSACEGLLRRPDVSEKNTANQSSGAVYLRAILLFLQNIGEGFDCIIHNEGILLADRVAFACKFLPRKELRSFLDASMRKCLQYGDLNGLVITGLDKRGIALLQSYVDRHADVQTAALISSRIILPTEWNTERKVCHEWLESYRTLLNNLQMWHSRAAFDCSRCDHIRNLKSGAINTPSGRRVAAKKQQVTPQQNFPPQLWARCNYCNASLSLSKLRRQEGIANSWLSRQNPVLTCCPQCKKPLPRCSICLLSLGCLNPYMELQRERNQYPRNATSMDKKAMADDLSGLAAIPFAEWFTWCMRCKHGGHAHHLVGWFSKHTSCPVSGCDCQCQFDGIEKLRRPGLK